MSDNIIDKARYVWTHAHQNPHGQGGHSTNLYGQGSHYKAICPPEVVSALLDVLDEVFRADSCVSCFSHRVYKHRPGCLVKRAEATIARALGEQKP